MLFFHWLKPAAPQSTSDEAAVKMAEKFVSQVVQEELALGRKRKSSERHSIML